MEHSFKSFNKDLAIFKLFKSKVEIDDLIEKLENLNSKTKHEEIVVLKDQLEGLMHSPGAGSIMAKNQSLPQITQKLLLHLNHFGEIF